MIAGSNANAQSYLLTDLAPLLGAPSRLPLPGERVEWLLIDSRQLTEPESTLFFALPGRHTHGRRFVADLYCRGVRAFVVDEPVADCPEAIFWLTPDVVGALQRVSAFHRQHFSFPVVGITGSNGKTTVKEWLYQLLSPHYPVWCSPRSYNSQVGVPLSVWGVSERHDMAIIEAGVSKAGDMARLASIVQPTLGIFTNIGAAHDQGFDDRAQKTREKSLLFGGAERVICCRDQELVFQTLGEQGIPRLSWSIEGREADLVIRSVVRDGANTRLEGSFKGVNRIIAFPFTDDIALENACHCWALLLHLGISDEMISRGMAGLLRPGLRLELKAGRNDCLIVDDTYSNDLTSLAAALSFAEQQGQDRRKTLILSDLLESGLPPKQLYPQVAALLGRRFDRVIGVGEAIIALDAVLPAQIERRFYPSTEALLSDLDSLAFRRELILLKGARAYGFERISYRLSKQTHRTVLEIDLSAVSHNLAVFRQSLAPGVKLAAMVKAAAYGSGGPEVGRLLEAQGVDYLVVAYPDEGVELRREGIRLPIMVLNAEPESFELLQEYQLEPEVYGWSQLRALTRLTLPPVIHLKLDTGMHRLGFDAGAEGEAAALTDFFRQHPRIRIASLFTHLAATENPTHDDYTHRQVALFRLIADALATTIDYTPLRHALNSNGIARFPDYQMDMVRLGIGLYGVEVDTYQHQLLPALSLKARVAQVRELPAGETVSYGRSGRLTRASRIATLSIGYADGFPRAAGYSKYAVRIHNGAAPTVGAICMDMCMVDVTDIPNVREGDTALIFGAEPGVAQLAQVSGTIPYEILTGISGRVHRLYIQE